MAVINSQDIKAKEAELDTALDQFDAVGRTIPALQEAADNAAAALKQGADAMAEARKTVLDKMREIMAIYQEAIDRNVVQDAPVVDPVVVPSASDLQPQV